MSDLATELLGAPNTVSVKGRSDGKPLRVSDFSPMRLPDAVSFIILGQPCSKANSRKIVTLARGKEHERTAVVKSKEALAYEHDALRQIPAAARVRFEGPVAVTIRLYYRTELPDLDESIVLDVLQDRWAKRTKRETSLIGPQLLQAGVYRNDRQVREKHVYHAIDRANPRAEITVQPLVAQQEPLF